MIIIVIILLIKLQIIIQNADITYEPWTMDRRIQTELIALKS